MGGSKSGKKQKNEKKYYLANGIRLTHGDNNNFKKWRI